MRDFVECQRFSHYLLVIVYSACAVVAAAVLSEPGSRAVVQQTLLVLAATTLGITALWYFATMTTRVDTSGIQIHTLFFIKRHIDFSEIGTCEATTYRPLRDYGGWGYRIGKRGKAYNMKGDEGVELAMRTGESLMIGSGQATQLAQAIERYR